MGLLTLSALSALSKVPKVVKVDPAENLMYLSSIVQLI